MNKIDSKFLKEYRCPACNKLLGKGHLEHKGNYLEVKCRCCKSLCLLSGEHAKILETRSRLLKDGLIPDTE